MMRAVRRDPHGDTVLAQISPQEAAMLAARGGAALPNPRMPEVTQFYSDSANEHSRATTGGNMADHSRPGGAGTQGGGYNGQGRPNTIAAPVSGGSMPMVGTGLRGPLGPTGDAGFTNQTGPAGLPTGQSDPSHGGGVGSNFEGAHADYANRDFMTRLAGWLTPFGEDQPNINQPKTFEHGLAHWSVNPAALAGMVAGGVTGIPLVGTVAGGLYHAAGLPNIRIGDASPGTPGNEVHDFSGTQAAPGAPQGGNMTSGGTHLLPPVSGAPGAPGAMPGAVPATPGALLPPIAAAPTRNTVPGGYQSIPGPYSYGWNRPSYSY